jgi:hypothetical protein
MGSSCGKIMTRVVISQPRYLPFLGYIQRLYWADIFVFLDNVQRQYRGFENRNKILVGSHTKWLSIPITSSKFAMINDSLIDGYTWLDEHQRKIIEAYKKHPFFDSFYINKYYENLPETLKEEGFDYSKTLLKLINNLANIFEFKANTVRASQLDIPACKGVENLFNICESVGASVYISGSNGRNYGVKSYFQDRGKRVVFHDSKPHIYAQFGNLGDFVPFLCFFDPLYNLGYSEVKSLILQPLELSEV